MIFYFENIDVSKSKFKRVVSELWECIYKRYKSLKMVQQNYKLDVIYFNLVLNIVQITYEC